MRKQVATLAVATVGAALTGAMKAKKAGADEVLTSFYGAESGSITASGEQFNPGGVSAAHPLAGTPAMPFGTTLKVCRLDQPNICVFPRVNDRGPALWTGKGLDLSYGAAQILGIVDQGVAPVSVEVAA